MPSDFHEIRFPLDIALGSQGGPERRTEIVTLGSGREERNTRWAHSRRRYDAGYGVKTLDALHDVIAFFEERRGRLYGFRWRDRADWKSCAPSQSVSPLDQAIGMGDGAIASFQLVKRYGAAHAPYDRPIRKPAAGSVRVAVNGVERASSDFSVDTTTGVVTFISGAIPASGAAITAGFTFDTPVRFEDDQLTIDFSAFDAGVIPKIPLIEIIV
ncbi:DUF2460 domain-containing protein [Terrarubrum flagellatum]|uniref:DUF2460 domain-containing protein n=1 Tax=Terrirubrum flagellatum TaxID=2895980 RepID=UPI0031451B1C